MAETTRSIALFAIAAVLEIGGAWLIWQGVREHRGVAWIGAGIAALAGYGFVVTFSGRSELRAHPRGVRRRVRHRLVALGHGRRRLSAGSLRHHRSHDLSRWRGRDHVRPAPDVTAHTQHTRPITQAPILGVASRTCTTGDTGNGGSTATRRLRSASLRSARNSHRTGRHPCRPEGPRLPRRSRW